MQAIQNSFSESTVSNRLQETGVPILKSIRDSIHCAVEEFTLANRLVPPLSLNVLKRYAEKVLQSSRISVGFLDYATVLLGNAIWQEAVSNIPYERRLLLLPQCLRTKYQCSAKMDNFGLLCEHCGHCSTGDIVKEAEELGYVVLVAEGSTIVTQLLESGQVEAVIGVGCLESLEKTFPYAIAAAIPAFAIPLHKDGCESTEVDVDRVLQSIHLLSNHPENEIQTTSINKTKSEVKGWFRKEEIHSRLSIQHTDTEMLGIHSMLSGGKRWRPILTVSVYQALSDKLNISDHLINVALAVECFHKASLIHDDIEDDDSDRYGKPTLHHEEGLAVALNVGDFLIGEGYRLLADLECSPEIRCKLLSIAANGHRKLTLGQGDELLHQRSFSPLSTEQTLRIFSLKTAPAFEVALNIGAACAGANDSIVQLLSEFSEALGIAYQIRDDIEDIQQDFENALDKGPKLSLVHALAWEQWVEKNEIIDPSQLNINAFYVQLNQQIEEQKVVQKAWSLFYQYQENALDVLSGLDHQNLKVFLFQIAFKILGVAALKRVNPHHKHSLRKVSGD